MLFRQNYIILFLVIASVFLKVTIAERIFKRDGGCDSDFWLKLCIDSVNGKVVKGHEYVTSGKNAGQTSDEMVSKAIKDIMKTQNCYLNRNANSFECTVDPAWNSADWSTWVDIEFSNIGSSSGCNPDINVLWRNREANGC